MGNLKLFITTVFVFICLFSFAQDKPDIVVKKENDSFGVSLKVENINELKKLKVQGFTFSEGTTNNFQLIYDYNTLKTIKTKEIELHKLGLKTDYVLYTVTTYNDNGEAKQLPSIKVNMPTGYSSGNKL